MLKYLIYFLTIILFGFRGKKQHPWNNKSNINKKYFNSLSYVSTKQIKDKLPVYEDTYFTTDSDYVYARDHYSLLKKSLAH